MLIKNGIIEYFIILFATISTKSISFEFFTFNIIPFLKFESPDFNGTFSLPINTIINYTFLNPKESLEQRCKISSNALTLPGMRYQTYPCEVSFHNEQVSIDNFPFYMLEKYNSIYESLGFSMSLYPAKDSNRLIDFLYNKNIIDKKELSIKVGNKTGQIIIGKTSETINYKYSHKCKVQNTTWSCRVNRIRISNKILRLNKDITFDTSSDDYIDSQDLFDFIIYNVLDIRKSKLCTVVQEEYSFKETLYCSKVILNTIQNAIFEFDDNQYMKINASDLFYIAGNSVYSKFSFDGVYDSNQNHFVFGFGFMKNFNLTIFDFDEKTITMYSNDVFMGTSLFNVSSFYFIIDILCLISISILFLAK